MSTSGLSGGLIAAVDSFRPTLVPRSTGHQALLFGLSAAIGYGVGGALRQAIRAAGLRHPFTTHPAARAALFSASVAGSTPLIAKRAKQEESAHADWGVPPMNPAVATAQGTLIAGAVVGGSIAAGKGIAAVGTALHGRFGGPQPIWTVGTVAATAAAGRQVLPIAKTEVYKRLSMAGRKADAAFTAPPVSRWVSGGPGSLIDYRTLAREGSRFVHLAAAADTISAITGASAKAPIRVFVGVDSAPTVEERVELAIAELTRLGAFERSAILAISPAGTGYANPVPAEALEMFTGGDCASVVVQYGVLPSMFSEAAVPEAAATYRLLTDRLAGQGPRLFGYGESLGAEAAQKAWTLEPSLLQSDGTFEGLTAVLMAGTPAGTGIRRSVEGKPGVFRADRWQDLPRPLPVGVRTWLLDHDADPVTRFEKSLIWRRPDWLAQQPRGRGVPAEMAWRPLLTWLQVGFDVARATQPQLGKFQSAGHDYRADLAPLVRAAFAPEASDELLARVGEELVASELRRAKLLAED